MDDAQFYCTSTGRPGPEWEAFTDTLPGYREHWDSMIADCESMFEQLQDNKG